MIVLGKIYLSIIMLQVKTKFIKYSKCSKINEKSWRGI